MVQERVQSRLGAISAADMVGYLWLMEADETGTIARQQARHVVYICDFGFPSLP